MKKLIDIYSKGAVICDNPGCDYSFPYESTSDNNSKILLAFVNVPCPKCGESLLTPEDYLMSERFMKRINWINKWFSWLTIFIPKAKTESISVHVHDGIKIKPAPSTQV
jgi:hypothetical protein